MIGKRTSYQERMKTLLREAQGGRTEAMKELYRRYHINKMLIDGQMVDLKTKFQRSWCQP